MLVLIPLIFIVFLLACVGLAVSIFLDIKKHKEKYDQEEELIESEETENTENSQSVENQDNK